MLWEAMGDDRALTALARIERALARLEAAAGNPAAPAAAGDGALAEAHQALRGKVERAIAQIDRLLETAEPD
jgi:hypothetical protein